jgi:hypothetical protein
MADKRISFKTLAKIQPDIVEKIVRYAVYKYMLFNPPDESKDFCEKIWDRYSFEQIAKKYFKEYIEYRETLFDRKEHCG